MKLFAVIVLFFAAASLPAQRISLEMDPIAEPRLWEHLERLPESNADRAAGLRTLFEEAGCPDPVDEKVRGSKLPNVVCTLSGETSDVILIGAHYDKVKSGRGAFDNWSGASMLAALLEAVRSQPRKFTFRFVGFADEEKGLIGSRSHARLYGKKNPLHLSAMVNIDTIGGAPSSIWLSRADERLARGLLGVANALNLPLSAVNVEQVGSTDSESFRKKKIPAITIHSLTQELFPKLHGEEDQLELVNRERYHEAYRLILAYLVYLDQVWPMLEPPSE